MRNSWFLASLIALPLSAAAIGPLTRVPWGQPQWQGSAADHGRGGAGLSMQDSTRLSESNPALFHLGRLTRMQMGFSGTRSVASDGVDENTMSSGTFDSWAVGFPLGWKSLQAGVRVSPLTSMDFHLAQRGTDPLGRDYIQSTSGSGGLSRAALVLARPMAPGLRMGIDLGLVFGSTVQDWKVFYPQAAPPYDSWIDQRRSLMGFQPRLGIHWQARSDLSVGLGWTLPGSAEFTVDVENRGNSVDAEIFTDRVDLPTAQDLGLALRRGGIDWLLDLRRQDWSGTPMGITAAENEARRENALGVAFGLEIPKIRDINAPWYRRWTWRAGMRHETWYARWENASGDFQDIRSLAFTVGAGVPLKAFGTWLDVALEMGRTGDDGELGLAEDFMRLRVDFGAQDLWFVRPKY